MKENDNSARDTSVTMRRKTALKTECRGDNDVTLEQEIAKGARDRNVTI